MIIPKRHNVLAVVSSMVIFTVFTGFCLTQITIKARAISESANASVTVGSACTLAKSVTSAHTASITNGTYYGDSGIGETLLQANCNDTSGFAIYAIGYTGDTHGANYLRDNTLYSTYNDTYDIQTGTGNTGDSKWSMKLTSVSNTDTPVIRNSYNNYHNVPTEYALVANKASGTTIDDGARVKATYTAYISGTQPAGTYEGKVKYALVHPASHIQPYIPYEITAPSDSVCYYPNTNEHVGTMGCEVLPSSNTTITLLANNYSREGYGFAGWSDVYDYETNPDAHFYGPQERLTVTAGQYASPNDGLSLYAVWVKSAGAFQDTDKVATLCGTGAGSLTTAPTNGTANLASVSALTDRRDGRTYAIAKLADGKCWMIENLRLESTAGYNSTGSLAQGYDASFIGLADVEYDYFSSMATNPNTLYTTQPNESGKITISGYYTGQRFPRYNNINTNSRASNPTTNVGEKMYSYGNYYTWHAAIADTNRYSSGDHGTTSICPKGWRLPIGGQSTASGSFGALSVALGGPAGGATADSNSTPDGETMSRIFRGYPNNFLYAGYFNTSAAYNRGGYGRYWSSAAYDDDSAYLLYVDDWSVNPGTGYYYKNYGDTIRCVIAN